jgi:hypothetical protein
MAGQLFKRYSGGKTLHQLRHSRLTHLGDQNVSAPLLMAISGHKRLATLQRYVKPSQAAVAALTAASDPDSRGRCQGLAARLGIQLCPATSCCASFVMSDVHQDAVTFAVSASWAGMGPPDI